MGRPAVLGDNLFDVRQYRSHVIDSKTGGGAYSQTAPSGFEAFRGADGRRSDYDYAAATAAASAFYLRSTFDQVRMFDYLAIDRNSNVLGQALQLWGTLDATDFSGTYETPLNLTAPSSRGPSQRLDNSRGVVTEEGVFLIRFPARAAKAIQLYLPSMGAGVTAQVGGIWCGLSWAPGSSSVPRYFSRPQDEEGDVFTVNESLSDAGWRGRSNARRTRQGEITYKLSDFFEYEQVRLQLRGIFGEGFPTWLVADDEQAERAVLAVRPADSPLSFPYPTGYGYRAGQVPWVELDPLNP